MKAPALTHTCNNLIHVLRKHIDLAQHLAGKNMKNEVLDAVRNTYWKCVQDGEEPAHAVERLLQQYIRAVLKNIVVEQKRAEEREQKIKAEAIEAKSRKAISGKA